MMNQRRLLAVDTTADHGSMALIEDGQVVEQIAIQTTDGFAHVLFGELRQLLDRHGWTLDSIGCFAAAAGPGSFTGVRVGLSAMKGLAEVMERPVVAVSNLRALASLGTSDEERRAIIDARRGEVYTAIYDASLQLIGEELVGPMDEAWFAQPVEVVTATPSVLPPLVKATVAPLDLAAAIGRLAWQEWNGGLALDPVSVDANYVRRSDAELFWKDR